MKQTNIVIPQKGDEQQLLHLYTSAMKAAFEAQGEGSLTEAIQEEVEVKMEKVLGFLNGASDYYYLAAKCDDHIVGTISYGGNKDKVKERFEELESAGELGSLYILPEYQSQGIGSTLINGMLQYMAEQGVLSFWFESGFTLAQKRWKRRFGEPYRIMKDHWAPGVDNHLWYCKVSEQIRHGEEITKRTLQPGKKYRHFKGNEYLVLHQARHSETREEYVVYQALYGEFGIWIRPLSMFLEQVEVEGVQVNRFEEIV